MRILKLEAENIKRLKAIEIIPEGDLVKISGKNEQGKSSTLDSIIYALCGKSAADVEPLRHGEKKGQITLNLGKYEVVRTYKDNGKSSLKVSLASTEEAIKQPQTVLDALYSDIAFDPLEFVRAAPGKQREILLGLVDIQLPEFDLARLAGGKIEDLLSYNADAIKRLKSDPIFRIESYEGAIFDQRRIAKKEHDKLAKAAKAAEPPLEEQKIEQAYTSDLFRQRKELENDQAVIDELRRQLELHEDELNERERVMEATVEALDEARNEVSRLEGKVAELSHLIELEMDGLSAERAKVRSLEDVDFSYIDDQIANVDAQNEKANKVLTWKEFKARAREAEKEVDQWEDAVSEIRKIREQIVTDAEFPVDGLGFNSEGIVTYEGVPISQRGNSQKIILGLKIGAALNPDLRVALIHEGNDLDEDNLQAVADWAAENDYQVWIETVANQAEEGAVYIEDGSVAAQLEGSQV